MVHMGFPGIRGNHLSGGIPRRRIVVLGDVHWFTYLTFGQLRYRPNITPEYIIPVCFLL